jgi:hypothetical protein
MAVSVTIVLIPSLAMIVRNAAGVCQAPRIKRPGITTRTRFSARLVHQTEPSPIVASAIVSEQPVISHDAIGRRTGERNSRWKMGQGPG